MRRDEDSRDAAVPFAQAWPAAEALLSFLREDPSFTDVRVAGDLRRFAPTVRRVELVAASPDPAAAAARLSSFPGVAETLRAAGGEREVRLAGGLEARLQVAHPDAFGAALLFRTGAPGHRRRLETRAAALGLSRHEGGLRDPAGRPLATPAEEDAFRALAYSPVPAVLREDGGELDDPALPPVVRPVELRGLAHVHTTWSDGRHTIREMALAARGLGFSWLAITDHSPAANANGLGAERLKAQREEVERVREAVPGIALLHGVEVDILEDGRLDHDDETLAWLDVVVASLHGPLDRDAATQTRRLCAALRNPLVGWVGHPTGRYHGYHPGYRIALDEVIAAAAEAGRALEVNGTPGRLDLSGPEVRRAIAGGARLVAAADAHSAAHVGRAFHAAHTAARGGATAAHVLTTLPVDGFLRAVGRPALADRYAASRGAAARAGAGSRASSVRS